MACNKRGHITLESICIFQRVGAKDRASQSHAFGIGLEPGPDGAHCTSTAIHYMATEVFGVIAHIEIWPFEPGSVLRAQRPDVSLHSSSCNSVWRAKFCMAFPMMPQPEFSWIHCIVPPKRRPSCKLHSGQSLFCGIMERRIENAHSRHTESAQCETSGNTLQSFQPSVNKAPWEAYLAAHSGYEHSRQCIEIFGDVRHHPTHIQRCWVVWQCSICCAMLRHMCLALVFGLGWAKESIHDKMALARMEPDVLYTCEGGFKPLQKPIYCTFLHCALPARAEGHSIWRTQKSHWWDFTLRHLYIPFSASEHLLHQEKSKTCEQPWTSCTNGTPVMVWDQKWHRLVGSGLRKSLQSTKVDTVGRVWPHQHPIGQPQWAKRRNQHQHREPCVNSQAENPTGHQTENPQGQHHAQLRNAMHSPNQSQHSTPDSWGQTCWREIDKLLANLHMPLSTIQAPQGTNQCKLGSAQHLRGNHSCLRDWPWHQSAQSSLHWKTANGLHPIWSMLRNNPGHCKTSGNLQSSERNWHLQEIHTSPEWCHQSHLVCKSYEQPDS